jgi:hypothetical protein
VTSKSERERRISSLRRSLGVYAVGELSPDGLLALAGDLDIMRRRVWEDAMAVRMAMQGLADEEGPSA